MRFFSQECFAVIVLAAITMSSPASTDVPLAEAFEQHDPASEIQLDVSIWQSFLDDYVVVGSSGITLVDYAGVSVDDREALTLWLTAMSKTNTAALDRDEQFVFWVNLYNGLTVDLILDHYPIKSIRDIDRFSVTSRGAWNDVLITVQARDLTLDNIEHDILRPLWKDARIHYVVNCASIGCPNLGQQALKASRLEEQLDAAAAAYINHARGVTVSGNRLIVSSLYKWYADDFGKGDSGIIEHLRKFSSGARAEALSTFSEISSYQYDWSLNDATKAR